MPWHECLPSLALIAHPVPGYPLSPNGVLRGRVVPMLPGQPLLGTVAAPCLCRWSGYGGLVASSLVFMRVAMRQLALLLPLHCAATDRRCKHQPVDHSTAVWLPAPQHERGRAGSGQGRHPTGERRAGWPLKATAG